MKSLFIALVLYLIVPCGLSNAQTSRNAESAPLRAGAAVVDISPRTFPAIRNGGFLQAVSSRVDDALHARCLILSNGHIEKTIAIVIVDSCMFPIDICDAIKARVTKQIGLPANRILISATHTHSAPSVMSFCLGTSRDEAYTEFVVPKVAESIVTAYRKMQTAKIGWTSVNAAELTNCRRWITRSDRMGSDPFGQRSVRAMMHPGYLNPNYVSPAGPIDPQLSVLSVVAAQDESPICVLANFSMHYFGGGGGFSADYFGEVARLLKSKITKPSATKRAGNSTRDFVGIMSQGTSGDLHWMNYAKSRRGISRSQYSRAMTEKVLMALNKIKHRSDVQIEMAEARINLRRRAPDAKRLAWAQPIIQKLGNKPPRNKQEVYAQQAEWIKQNPKAEVVLQAIRVGELGIAAMPNEVYGITGLKIKQQSPLAATFNLELANGAAGYIPPPEQHRLGGYTTWPARTAGLEMDAEPKIVATVLSLLEKVSNKKRRPHIDPVNVYSQALLKAKPKAYWRLGDIAVDRATDVTGNYHAAYKGGVALYLPGIQDDSFEGIKNRSVYFAGGSLQARVPDLNNEFSVSFWFWHGLPSEKLGLLGTLFRQGADEAQQRLLIVGDENGIAKIAFKFGKPANSGKAHSGKTPLATKQWHQAVLVRSKENVAIYLDGKREIETELAAKNDSIKEFQEIAFGDFDGKLDEIALFDRAVSETEIAELYRISGMKPPKTPRKTILLREKPSDDRSLLDYAKAVKESKPVAFWRLHDFEKEFVKDKAAKDEMGKIHGRYEGNSSPRDPGSNKQNFSGGRMMAEVSGLGNQYSVEFWFRNELPNTSRAVTGYMFTRGEDAADGAPGDCFGIGGTHSWTGRLFVFNGNKRSEAVSGSTPIVRGSWNYVALTRDGKNINVYLNGDLEIEGSLSITYPKDCKQLFIGGRNDNFANFDGMIDEVAVYDRVISAAEVTSHFKAAKVKKSKTSKQK